MKNKYRIVEVKEEIFWLESIPNTFFASLYHWEKQDIYMGKLTDAKNIFEKTINKIENYPKYYKI